MIVLRPSPEGLPQRVHISVPVCGRAAIDFGAGATDARVVVTGQSAITAQSVVLAKLLYEPTVDHSADEHLVEELDVMAGAIVAGVGFTIVARTRNLALYGRFNVGWVWS